MAIFKPYSQREKERLGCVPDVYSYGPIPKAFRNQITKIWERFFGKNYLQAAGTTLDNPSWKQLRSDIAEHSGEMDIEAITRDNRLAVCEWFSYVENADLTIDALDISVNVMVRFEKEPIRQAYWKEAASLEDAIEEINTRLRQHGIGYEFLFGSPPLLIRKDNEHLHKEAVLPALNLLHDLAFKGADDEYRSAHRHYLEGNYKECLVDCLKAFESTMKTICERRKWRYEATDTASVLINTCLNNGLLHGFMESHLMAVRNALLGSTPTVRNKMGGHGQGEEVNVVPRFYAEYLLHETAVTIVLLVEGYKNLPPVR